MEEFRCVADETFPSSLANSLTISEILDNITISSNLGLPVAASTEARQKTGCHDRLCDDQVSYMEERLSVASASSKYTEPDSNPRKNLALNFQDTVENCSQSEETLLESDLQKASDLMQRKQNLNCFEGHLRNRQDAVHEMVPLEQTEGLSAGICSLLERESIDYKAVSLNHHQKWLKGKIGTNKVNGFSSFIENERLLTSASLEGHSTDDDIGDKEFCDDELEEYFERLVLPEIPVEDTDEQKLGSYSKATELLTVQENFQIPNVCQPASGMDSSVVSDEEVDLIKQLMLPVTGKQQEYECSKSITESGPSDSSSCKSSVAVVGDASEITSRTNNSPCSCLVGCRDNGSKDEIAFQMNSCSNRSASREHIEQQSACLSSEECAFNRDATDLINSTEMKLDSLYFKYVDGNHDASEAWSTEQQAQSSHLCRPANESPVPLADVYLSPSACKSADQYEGTEEQPTHDVVYLNEEGRWVTDLAYYTSFNKEQVFNLANTDEDFITGSEAIAMIAQGQEDFEREHRFMQEEKMDTQNTSGLGDTSWKSVSYNPLRSSQMEDFSKDASYLRLSLGEFFGQRSEALGCLGVDGDVKRPSFGYYITSPKKRPPVALLRQSDVSSSSSDQPSYQLSDTLKVDLEEIIEEQLNTASTTFTLNEMDTQANKNENINIQMDTQSKMQEHLEKSTASKKPELKSPILNISTIASAIANASVSAEPSQLATMIMTLLNKTRERTNIHVAGKPPDVSVISQLLSSNIENSTFDIEKYLRSPEEPENDSKLETLTKQAETAVPGKKYLYKQECQFSPADSLSESNLYVEEKQRLERLCEKNCFKYPPCDTSSSDKEEQAGYLVPWSEAASNIGQTFRSSNTTSAVPSSKDIPSGSAEVLLEENLTHTDHATYAEPTGRTSRSTFPIGLKSVPVLVSPFPVCPSKEKVTQCQDKQSGNLLKGNATCKNEKHVTFEKTPVDYQKIVCEGAVISEPKPASPVLGQQTSDDEQYNFRPSTSPLIHSSPSEASGTVFSGSDVDCPCTASDLKQSTCSESALPQSVYSTPSSGRLTFVSAAENTLKNLELSSPGRRQTSVDSELSTTIVWASPTSLLEQDAAKKNIALQITKQPSQRTSQINFNSAEPNSQPENQKSDTVIPSKSEDPSAHSCQKIAHNKNELDQLDKPVTLQGYTNTPQGLGLSTLNMLPTYNGLGGCIPLNPNITSLKPPNPTTEIPAVPSVIPTLLTGCSLQTTPFAQQYLGNFTSCTNVALPQYHVGCPPVFGLPAGLIYSNIPVGPIQKTLSTGMTLGPDVGSGVFGTTPHCSLTSSQSTTNHKPCTRPVADVGRPRQWMESVPFCHGFVKVPEELKFPNACCVGLTSQTILSIFNPSEHWRQVGIRLLSITLNGEKMESLKPGCLLFKNKAVIGPCSTEELTILFLPCHAGVFQCVLSVASWPFSADADVLLQAEALAARVILNAVAENPDVEVEAGKEGTLDFGDLPYGSWKAFPLKLTNKTHARVPIRLVINANAVAWRCFTFSKESVTPFTKSAFSQLAAPSVISHVMNPSYVGQEPEVLVVWVQFHAPSKPLSSDSLGPPDEYFARIDVEVDCPEPPNILRSIPLCARSGIPRIYAPKGLQTLYMSARIGSSTKQYLPLKNAGNIKVDLKILALEPDKGISVEPEDLVLVPGEEQEVTVEFSPKNSRNSESVLKIVVLPSGPEYKVTVKGDVSPVECKPMVLPLRSSSDSEVPPILANKQLVTWGGVQLGRTVQQKLILRNDSPSTTQQLRLLIRGQDQDCFQVKLGEHMYNSCEIKIQPKQDYNIHLIFTPSHLACMLAKLEMKQLGFLSQLAIKFTIPLYGYGGKCNVILEGVRKQQNKYIVGLNELSPGTTSQVSLSLSNTGCRAAYVTALCFRNFCDKIVMNPNVMQVFPNKFILKEGAQQKVTITCNPTEREQNNASVLSTVCFFYGDEISRQQYCRAMQQQPEQNSKVLPPNNPVVNVKFDEEFPGEELVTEIYDLPQHTSDIQNFYTNMRRIAVSVVNANNGGFNVQPLSIHHGASERPCISEIHSMPLDVLPVKGPQGCVLSSHTNGLDEKTTWTVQPEFLKLTVPFPSGITVTKYIRITNHSNRSLTFELSWPAHCLTVTPQHGTIEPESCVSIHVSANPSLSEKEAMFPWSGLIYIHCDNGQKLVRVQIHENNSEEQPRKGALANEGTCHLHTEPHIIQAIKPVQKLSTKIEIKNRTLVFPETRSDESSEQYLEIENNGDVDMKWVLSSFAPPYVKGADGSGEVYRATYTAFRCSCISGTLGAHGKERVVITFLPRDRGDYSQFWDLECHPLHEARLKDKHRLQFSGVGVTENEVFKKDISIAGLVKVNIPITSQRRDYPATRVPQTGKGVHADKDVYTFPPTRVGESSMLKIRVRNYSNSASKLNFVSPRDPFCIKYSCYNLRCLHYCNIPVSFKPMSAGTFKSVLVVQTEKNGTLTIQLIGDGLA